MMTPLPALVSLRNSVEVSSLVARKALLHLTPWVLPVRLDSISVKAPAYQSNGTRSAHVPATQQSSIDAIDSISAMPHAQAHVPYTTSHELLL